MICTKCRNATTLADTIFFTFAKHNKNPKEVWCIDCLTNEARQNSASTRDVEIDTKRRTWTEEMEAVDESFDTNE